jgi:excisionase family DNA binding protein
MTIVDRVAAIVQALPESGAVTLPVAELRRWLDEDSERTAAATPARKDAEPDRWLSAEEVANALDVSRRYVYAHRKSLPFAKELPGGSIRFSERGLRRWMERRG